MTDIPKLMLIPLRDDYSPSLARSVTTTETIVGLPRQRNDSVGKVHRANVSYRCTAAQWQYFLTFTRAYEALPFLAQLQLDNIDLQWYECQIVSDSMPFSVSGYQIFTVQLSLVAKPIKYNVDSDLAFLKIHQMTEGEVEEYFKALAKFTNEDMPNTLGKIGA